MRCTNPCQMQQFAPLCDLQNLLRHPFLILNAKLQETMAGWNTGVYKNRLLARKVYDAAILVMVLGQEGGLVPSEGFPKPPFSQSGPQKGVFGGQNGQKWQKRQLHQKNPKIIDYFDSQYHVQVGWAQGMWGYKFRPQGMWGGPWGCVKCAKWAKKSFF